MKHRLKLGRFVGHQAHHCLRPPHAAQLVDHAEHRMELRADEHLPRVAMQVNGEQGAQHNTAQQRPRGNQARTASVSWLS